MRRYEATEDQGDVSLAGIVADHLGCHVGHLQVADIGVVQDDGTVLGFVVVPAQLFQLFGDIGDPPLCDPPYCGGRGRMPGVSEQGDLGAVGRDALEGGLQGFLRRSAGSGSWSSSSITDSVRLCSHMSSAAWIKASRFLKCQ